MKVAINGFGRIGRLFFRQAWNNSDLEIVAINDLGNVENLAYLLKYDTVYRAWDVDIKTDVTKGILIVDGKEVKFLQQKDATQLPWGQLGIDVVIESTGVFESYEKSKVHLDAGARRVVITAPAKDADGELGQTVLVGVNEDKLSVCKISSNGSCTTNSASPVIAILSQNPGIEKAVLNTIHSYTATQTLTDSPTKGNDFRRGRAAAQNIVPSTTGAAIAVTRAVSGLDGNFDGLAIRVPSVTGSISDITFISKRPTTVEEINSILRQAASSSRWQGILEVSDQQLVSSDIIGAPFGAIVDSQFTKVIGGNLVKVLSWYDNEWGYATTLIKHLAKIKEIF